MYAVCRDTLVCHQVLSIPMLSPTSDMCSQMSVVSLLKCRLARPKMHRPTAAMLNPKTATYVTRHSKAMHETDEVTSMCD